MIKNLDIRSHPSTARAGISRKFLLYALPAIVLLLLITSCGGKTQTVPEEKPSPFRAKARRAQQQTDDYSYAVNDAGKGAIITAYMGNGGDVVVPATINNLPVVEIGDGAFRGRGGDNDDPKPGDEVVSVVVPAGVVKIGRGAFADCRKLTSVVLPDTVEEIREVAFRGSANLHTANIPAGIKVIGLNAFFRSGELANLSIPDSITSIQWDGWNHFSGCAKLPPATRQRLKALGYPAGF